MINLSVKKTLQHKIMQNIFIFRQLKSNAKNDNFGRNLTGEMVKNINFGGKLIWQIFSKSDKFTKIASGQKIFC